MHKFAVRAFCNSSVPNFLFEESSERVCEYLENADHKFAWGYYQKMGFMLMGQKIFLHINEQFCIEIERVE